MNASGATLDRAPLDQPLDTFGVEHVVERVVERTQIRVHLLLQIARKEPELLPRLHRRAHEDDARDFLGEQERHGLRHREIRLPRSRRPYPKDDVLVVDRLEVAALVHALGQNLLSAGLARRAAAKEVVAKLHALVLCNELPRRLHVSARQLVTVAHERGELVEHALGPGDVGRGALDHQVVAVRTDRHTELRLERFEILVVGAEERFDALFGDRNPARRRSGYCLGLLGVQL